MGNQLSNTVRCGWRGGYSNGIMWDEWTIDTTELKKAMPWRPKSKAKRVEQRGNSTERGYNYEWQKYRVRFLFDNPVCVECMSKGIVKAATVVDHIVPHRGNKELFDNIDNHQALCRRCHSAKTARGE